MYALQLNFFNNYFLLVLFADCIYLIVFTYLFIYLFWQPLLHLSETFFFSVLIRFWRVFPITIFNFWFLN